jgi:hypothetical protein
MASGTASAAPGSARSVTVAREGRGEPRTRTRGAAGGRGTAGTMTATGGGSGATGATTGATGATHRATAPASVSHSAGHTVGQLVGSAQVPTPSRTSAISSATSW